MIRALALVIAFLTLAATAGSAGALPVAGGDAPADAPAQAAESDAINETRPADEIYVEEDGDAVLVYRTDDGELISGRYGVHVGRNLLHALVRTETDNTAMAGGGTLVLSPDRLVGNGSLITARPEAVRDLSLDVKGVTNRKRSSVDATFAATVARERASLFTSAETTGRLRVGPNSIATAGRATTEFARPLPGVNNRSYDVRETDDGYVVEAHEEFTVERYERGEWNTSERAHGTLRARYLVVAMGLDGSATFSLDSYDYEERPGGPVVDVDYTVRYTGIKQGLRDAMTTSLAESEEYNLSEAEAASIADRITTVEIDTLHAEVERWNDTAAVRWDVRLDGTTDATLAALDLVEASPAANGSNLTAQLDRTRAQLDAQREAGLVRTLTWSADATPGEETIAVNAEVHSDAGNWSAYVAALEERGIDRGEESFELHAETTNDGTIDTTASVEVRRDDLVSSAVEAMAASAETDRGTTDTEAVEALRAFQEAGFERARMDVSVGRRAVQFRAATSFENMSAFRDAMERSYGGRVRTVSGRIDNGTSTTYVRVSGLVGSDASASDVRGLPVADNDTTIHAPGEWDRSFPAMNTADVGEYLGVEVGTPTPAADDGGDTVDATITEASDDGGITSIAGPGFGPVVAVLALLLSLVAARRYA